MISKREVIIVGVTVIYSIIILLASIHITSYFMRYNHPMTDLDRDTNIQFNIPLSQELIPYNPIEF